MRFHSVHDGWDHGVGEMQIRVNNAVGDEIRRNGRHSIQRNAIAGGMKMNVIVYRIVYASIYDKIIVFTFWRKYKK